ncbi:TPA: hypothetical protein DCL30_01255 [Candidatus Peribacteria bacterium]|nr:MAG: hypothetical protein A3J91_01270 [Candidatus Peribacteria bacterium RIFOXYC2_FULL_58_10]OGJ84336.1 MAG: hypothetical protein A2529_05825 [Candidatus Peribacteria bacterium RIFOXYD2_FULL_58_15]HAI98155.1 hypothetical protein [Candidatus Peribacteria bacterium]HAS34564.1 hypothetical protein [Candidatus Peribacteria bacterium]
MYYGHTVFLDKRSAHRSYKSLPLPARLELCRRRFDRNTKRFPRPRPMLLRYKLAKARGLPDCKVWLDQDGNLWHASCSEPIASANGHP